MGRSLSTAEALPLYYNPNGGKSQEKIKKYFPEQIRSRTAQDRTNTGGGCGGKAMTYTMTKNAEFGGLEITFDGKPCAAIRDALKLLS